MNEISQRIEFDNPDSDIKFLNIHVKRFADTYKYQCLLKDYTGLLEYTTTIYESDLTLKEARECIYLLTEDAFDYFFEQLLDEESD